MSYLKFKATDWFDSLEELLEHQEDSICYADCEDMGVVANNLNIVSLRNAKSPTSCSKNEKNWTYKSAIFDLI